MFIFSLTISNRPGHSFNDVEQVVKDLGFEAVTKDIKLSDGRSLGKVVYSTNKKDFDSTKDFFFQDDTGIKIFLLGSCFPGEQAEELLKSNSIDLSKPTPELIYDLLQIAGTRALHNLHGDFNIVIVDLDGIICITSHLGLLPIYYSEADGGLSLSNSLSMLGKITGNHTFNYAVLAQISLYNYSISDETFLKGCKVIPPGMEMRFDNNELTLQHYWDPTSLQGRELLSNRESIDAIDHKLRMAIKRYAKSFENCALSLTGGWDGRLALAYLLKEKEPCQILLYSFGSEQSPDVVIPAYISKNLGLEYWSIILDDSYLENHFDVSAVETALHSDGYRSIQRAHYLYTMKDLSYRVSSVISGNCGSNLMKPIGNTPSLVFNSRVIELLHSDDPDSTFVRHYNNLKKYGLSCFDNLSNEDFVKNLKSPLMDKVFIFKNYANRASVFILSFLERKYFGYELHSYRKYVKNLSPFVDIGFLNTISQTTYFNGFKESKGVFSSWRNSLLYSKLMMMNNPRLADFMSDKRVRLTEMSNPVMYPIVALKRLHSKKFARKKPIDHFNTGKTVEMFVNNHSDILTDLNAKGEHDDNILGIICSALYWYKTEFNN